MTSKKNLWIFMIIGIAAMSRLLPHPPNFTMIGALALFGGVVIENKFMKFFAPLVALFISDLVVNNTLMAHEGHVIFYPGMLWVYASFLIMTAMGSFISKVKVLPILGGAIGASIAFFVVTNFGYWLSGVMYPLTATGLAACYTAAIPFFGGTALSTVLYSAILFGAYHFLVEKRLELAPAK